MAKRIEDIIPQPSGEVVPFPIVPCGCGCGTINLNEHAYIYCNGTGQYYADLVCMSFDIGEDVDMLDMSARKQFLERWEAVSHG